MLRNMVLLGTAIGVAVAFPIIYEAKRDVIHDVLRGTPHRTMSPSMRMQRQH
jgi:ABC-type phosphate/phosphonate transport system permease subunit